MFMQILLGAALAGPPPEASELSDELAALYIEAMAGGEPEKATGLFAQVNEGAPAFSPAFRNRCAAERYLKHGDEARKLCERAVAIDPTWVNHAALVRDAIAAKDYDAAGRFVEAALEAHPDHLEILKLSCDAALRADDMDELETRIARIDTSHSEDPWAEFYRYALFSSRGDREGAIVAMERAVALGLPSRGRAQMARIPLPPEGAVIGGRTIGMIGGTLLLFALGFVMWRKGRSQLYR